MDLLKLEKECSEIGVSSFNLTILLDYKGHHVNGMLFSPEYRRKFELANAPFRLYDTSLTV